MVFFALVGAIGSVFCFAEGESTIGTLLLAGSVIMTALLPFWRSTYIVVAFDGVQVQVLPKWWVSIAWEDIATAELFCFKTARHDLGTNYLALMLTSSGKQKFGTSWFAVLLNACSGRHYHCYVCADLLTLRPKQLLDLFQSRMDR
jgi:hypothetical protein